MYLLREEKPFNSINIVCLPYKVHEQERRDRLIHPCCESDLQDTLTYFVSLDVLLSKLEIEIILSLEPFVILYFH